MTGKWQTEGTFDTALEKLGAEKRALVHWDFSGNPVNNSDRRKKLGSADKTMGIAIASYSEQTRNAKFVTGLTPGGIPITSYRVHEPDSMVLRLHDAKGYGPDSVWQHRDIVEHENNDYERKHRSDMVINQKASQIWAWKRDQWRVVALGASVSHDELAFDPAGYLRMARSNNVATGGLTRGCLALSTEKRGGHFTDGALVAQLWHVLSMKALGGNQTVSDVDVSMANGALRGDVNFHLGSQLAHLAFEYAFETDGYKWSGMHWINTPAPIPPDREMSTDPKSNQVTVPRNSPRGIWVWVKVPPGAVPTGGGIPPLREFKPPAGAIVVDTKSLPSAPGGNGGGFTYGNFLPGLNTDEPMHIAISEVGGPTDLRVLISWKPSVALAGGDVIELALVYKVVPAIGAIPASVLMVTKQLTPADNPASDLGLIDWTIPNICGGDMKGGFIQMSLFRRGREASDTFAGIFKQAGSPRVHFKPRPKS